MKMYKGFDQNLKCKNYQYEVGKEYEEPSAKLCSKGFHACEFPMDVFSYYPPADSRYCEVDLDATQERHEDDSKRVGKKIKISAEIGIPGIIKAGVEYIKDQVDWENSKENTGDRSAATNTGNQSAATNTGNQSAATNTGDRSAATNTGNWSAATNTGDRSAATNTGNQSAAIVTGKDSVAIATGYQSKAKGAVGCFIVLAERDLNNNLLDVKAVKVDGANIKPDTFYMLKSGKFVEVCED